MQDTFRTIEQVSEGFFRDRGSKFLAFAYPMQQEAEIHSHIEVLKKAHPKARHFCYAYRIGTDGLRFRANDDGEPSGTAGKPILGQIDSFGVTNLGIVVVRYFGGTLLGASGLIQAYRAAAADALQQAEIVEKQIEQMVRLEFPYLLMNGVMHAVKQLRLPIYFQQYEEQGILEIGIPRSQVTACINHIKILAGGLHPEEAEMGVEVEGLSITLLQKA